MIQWMVEMVENQNQIDDSNYMARTVGKVHLRLQSGGQTMKSLLKSNSTISFESLVPFWNGINLYLTGQYLHVHELQKLLSTP